MTGQEIADSLLNPPETWTPKLAPKHQGMMVSAYGLLTKTRNKAGLNELFDHLAELAERYYAGDELVVDEFLQLYRLGERDRERLTRIVR